MRDNVQTTENINVLRGRIDEIDGKLVELLAKRMAISKEIGTYKKEHNMPVLQTKRYGDIMKDREKLAESLELNKDFVAGIMESIHRESVDVQMKIMTNREEKKAKVLKKIASKKK